MSWLHWFVMEVSIRVDKMKSRTGNTVCNDKRNILSCTCTTVLPNGENPAYRIPLTDIVTCFEHCSWLRSPSDNDHAVSEPTHMAKYPGYTVGAPIHRVGPSKIHQRVLSIWMHLWSLNTPQTFRRCRWMTMACLSNDTVGRTPLHIMLCHFG